MLGTLVSTFSLDLILALSQTSAIRIRRSGAFTSLVLSAKSFFSFLSMRGGGRIRISPMQDCDSRAQIIKQMEATETM